MGNIYVGVNDVSRKIKGAYIGVDGVARKVKQIYVGVNGVARLVWKAVQSFTNWSSLLFSSTRTLDSLTTSHDTPYVTGVGIKKIRDNEFICSGSIAYRMANESSSTTAFRKFLTVDDNGYVSSDPWSRSYDAYYMNGYYYFINLNTNMNNSYPLVKNTSMDSYNSTANTTVFTPPDSQTYYLINYCKVDNNTFAIYCYHYNSATSNYRYIMYLINSSGVILNSYNSSELYINVAAYGLHSQVYYVSDRKLVCVLGTNLYIIEISTDYKTRTVTPLNIGAFTHNGTTYTPSSVSNFLFYNGNIIATFDVTNGYPENYNRVFIPIKVNYDSKTFSKGTNKLIENCGSIGMSDNSFIENNTLVIFTRKQINTSSFGHYCILIPYNSETNTFDNHIMINGSSLPSGSTYDTYYGFVPIKTNANPSKLLLFDTSSTQPTSTTWQFYYRTGSITLN